MQSVDDSTVLILRACTRAVLANSYERNGPFEVPHRAIRNDLEDMGKPSSTFKSSRSIPTIAGAKTWVGFLANAGLSEVMKKFGALVV